MMEEILLIILGALIAIISSYLKAKVDRRTVASSNLLERRILALNDIWVLFTVVKNIYAKQASKGYEKWIEEDNAEAQKCLNKFRDEIDKHQIILPHEVISILREIDTFMHVHIHASDTNHEFSQYQNEITAFLKRLSNKANKILSKNTHTIDLNLRT